MQSVEVGLQGPGMEQRRVESGSGRATGINLPFMLVPMLFIGNNICWRSVHVSVRIDLPCSFEGGNHRMDKM